MEDLELRRWVKGLVNVTLGAKDFPSAVSCFGVQPKMVKICPPSANTEYSRRTREKPLVPRVCICIQGIKNLQQLFERWDMRAPIHYWRALTHDVAFCSQIFDVKGDLTQSTASRKGANSNGRLFEIARLFRQFFPKFSRFDQVTHLSPAMWS